MSHRPTDAAPNEKFFPFAGEAPNAVERSAILAEVVAPRERGAKLAKWTTAELHGHLAEIARTPKRTAPRHPARVAQIVARLSRRTDQILVPGAVYTASVAARQRRWSAAIQPAHDGNAPNFGM
jgi:hypothetical protein